MTGSGIEVHSLATIVLWPLILISYNETDGSSQRDAEFGARLDFYLVFLISGRR